MKENPETNNGAIFPDADTAFSHSVESVPESLRLILGASCPIIGFISKNESTYEARGLVSLITEIIMVYVAWFHVDLSKKQAEEFLSLMNKSRADFCAPFRPDRINDEPLGIVALLFMVTVIVFTMPFAGELCPIDLMANPAINRGIVFPKMVVIMVVDITIMPFAEAEISGESWLF